MWAVAFGLLKSPLGKHLVLGVGLACAVWAVVAYLRHTGYSDCERRHQERLVEAIRNAEKAAREIALKDAEIMLATERAVTKWRTKTIEVVRRVDGSIPPDCARCAIDPGLRNDINSLLRGETPDSGKPEGAMPNSTPSSSGNLSGDNGRSCCDGWGVERVPGET